MAEKSRPREVGHRISGVLAAKGWVKTELISRSGLKQASVYEWLRGESEPRGHALSKLAQALEVSTDYLLGSDPTYDDLSSEEVATRESLRLCLRERGIGPAHPDYLLYQEIATSDGAPKTVNGWHDLITQVLPKITEHLRAKSRSHRGERPRRILPLKAPKMSRGEEKEPLP